MAVRKTPRATNAGDRQAKKGRSSSSSADAPQLLALPEDMWRDVFGLTRRGDRAFAERLVAGLQKIDRGLLPPTSTHPFAEHIAAGSAGLAPLLDVLDTGTEREWLDALDAVAHIAFAHASSSTPLPADVLPRLRAGLGRPQATPEQRTLIAKTLALAGDEALLREQLTRLTDEDPAVVASAARLLGLGRFRPAAPALRELVSPARFFEARPVIWALGEIGDVEALPVLYRALAEAFRVVDCLIAIGKIGQIASLGALTPMALDGAAEQRDAAWRAIAMVLDQHRDAAEPLAPIFQSLRSFIEAQLGSDAPLSGSTRFHMLLCLARMGVGLDPARVRAFLRLGVDDAEATALASVFGRRR
jgi:HEAT repeat protein